jgi:long-chain fatty acid transport protein
MIVSTGVAYRGFERWLLEADFRYVDYANTAGFRESGFDASGALRGLGWRSIFALAVGAQYQLTDALAVRLGYSFNQNPIPDSEASENVGAPVVIQHTLYLGASYRVSEALLLSAAYLHAFGNSIEGPLVSAAGPVPDTQVQDTILGADALVAGLTVQFGAGR